MPAWQALQDQHLFDFSVAVRSADTLMEDAGPGMIRIADSEGIDYDLWRASVEELVVAGAGHVALSRAMANPVESVLEAPLDRHLVPTAADARLAFLKVDSSGTRTCFFQDVGSVPVWEVLLFGGDIAKLTALGAGTVGEFDAQFYEVFDEYLQQMRSSPSPHIKRVYASGAAHLEGALWQTALSIVTSGEDSASRVGQFLSVYGQELPQPSGMRMQGY